MFLTVPICMELKTNFKSKQYRCLGKNYYPTPNLNERLWAKTNPTELIVRR